MATKTGYRPLSKTFFCILYVNINIHFKIHRYITTTVFLYKEILLYIFFLLL